MELVIILFTCLIVSLLSLVLIDLKIAQRKMKKSYIYAIFVSIFLVIVTSNMIFDMIEQIEDEIQQMEKQGWVFSKCDEYSGIVSQKFGEKEITASYIIGTSDISFYNLNVFPSSTHMKTIVKKH